MAPLPARLAPLLALLSTAGIPTAVLAAPIQFEEQRDQYMIFRDVDDTVQNGNWFARDPFLQAFRGVESGFLAAHPDDSQFVVMYTTATLPQGIGAFFQSVANDVHGVGYEHAAPEDAVIPDEGNGYFDDTPDSQISGFLHMNRWTQYLGADAGGVDDSTISLIFGQELGHAWLAFVYYQQVAGGSWQTDMLGRSNAHWSFYMHSGGSPVQGHDWRDNGDGTFTAIKHDLYRYSDLDLYLMGLLPPEEVEPWFVLDNPTNCIDSSLRNHTCAPRDAFIFAADSYTVTATRRNITIDEVIAVEGPRTPAYGSAPDQYDISFILVLGAGEELSEEEKLQVDTIVTRSIDIFEDQTRGYASIINRTASDSPGGDTGGTGQDTGDTGETTGSDVPTTGLAGSGDSGAGLDTDAADTTSPEGANTSAALPPDDPQDPFQTSSSVEGCGCTGGDKRTQPWWFGLAFVALAAGRRRQ